MQQLFLLYYKYLVKQGYNSSCGKKKSPQKAGTDLFAGFHKSLKNLSLQFYFPEHMLRMPLDTQTEGVCGMYHRFHIAVFAEGADLQILSQNVHHLVVQTVNSKLRNFQNVVQHTSGHHIDFVESGAAALEI